MEPRAIRFAGEASRSSSPWQRLGLAVLVVVGALTLFYRLGSIGLIDADEPRYSEAAREMRERGDLLVPWLNGEPRLNKPALVYWAIAASQSLFGTNEWASRLPSGLAALATTIVIYRWARRRSGSTAAAFSALVFVTSPLVVMVARLAIPDMALTAFETFAVLNLYRSDRASHERSRSRARLAAWASLGLAAMTKGPVGVVVPLLVLVVFLALEGRLGNVRRLFSMPALALFVAISLPWYVAVGFALGFREGFELLVHETLYRYSSASFHSEPMTFFLGVFAVGFLPWIPSLAAALAIRPDDEGARERRFLLAWIGVVLVFFSLSPSKLPTYILPLAPAVALLVGTTFDRAVRASASARERTFARLAVGMGAGLVAVAAAFAGVVYGIGEGATDIASLGLVLAGIASLSVLAAWRAPIAGAVFLLSLLVGLSVAAAHRVAGAAFEELRSMKPLAPLLENLRAQDTIVVCDLDKPGVMFYSRRTVETTDSVDEVATQLRERPRTFAIVRRGKLPDLLRRTGPTTEIEVLWRHESWTLVRGRP